MGIRIGPNTARVFSIQGDVARVVMPDGQWIEVPLARLPEGVQPGSELAVDRGASDRMGFGEAGAQPGVVDTTGPGSSPAVPPMHPRGQRFNPNEMPANYAGQVEPLTGTGEMGPLSSEERDWAVRTIIGEASGEGMEGMQAVGNVILNRTFSGRYGNSVKDVVLAKSQFEPWSVRRNELLGIPTNSPKYQEASAALDLAMQEDITGGATHFLNPEIVKKRRGGTLPRWARGPELAAIGHHTFYAPEGAYAAGSVGAYEYDPMKDFSMEKEYDPTSSIRPGAVVPPQQYDPLSSVRPQPVIKRPEYDPLTSIGAPAQNLGQSTLGDIFGARPRTPVAPRMGSVAPVPQSAKQWTLERMFGPVMGSRTSFRRDTF